jgi:hypothetical protein
MKFEILFGLITILAFAIWAAIYIRRSSKDTNKYTFDFIPHLFPTLGILFTFLGIAIGLWNFDSNNIEKSIPELMDGLKTAFLVSILGVALLVIFSFITNIKKQKLEEGVLSDEVIAINKLTAAIIELKSENCFIDDNGNKVTPGNLFRGLYEESKKQSNSLQTFSTDLALTISAGFEQILNDPNEGVVAELKLVRSEVENLGNKLKDPATDMTQSIVKELQEAMGKMIEEFKTSMSGDTKNEMEQLAKLLGQAGNALTDFPDKLTAMTENLNENFRGLQDVVKQISTQMQAESIDSTQKIKKDLEDLGNILKGTMGNIQGENGKLTEAQSKNLELSENLLNAFNSSIDKMNGLSTGVSETVNRINQAQMNLDMVIGNFKHISTDVKASSTKFGDAQVTFSKYSTDFLNGNTKSLQEIQKSLSKAKDVSTDYAEKFDVIEKGLQQIFAKINTGLKDYQITVGQSLEDFLGKYTEHLTKTAESLAAASSKQEDILEELTEQLSRLNGKKN